MKKKISTETLKLLFLLAYFAVITAERIASLVLLAVQKSERGPLDTYMAVITLVSLVSAYAYIFLRGRKILKGRKHSLELLMSKASYKTLSISAGVLVTSAMTNMNSATMPIKYTAFALLVGSMAVHTYQNARTERMNDRKWLSLIYVAAYFMSIPIVCHTSIEMIYLFVPVEITVSVGMTALFTIMLIKFYTVSCESTFSIIPFLVALFGDALIISVRWYEAVDMRLLAFVCITTVVWFTGSILGNDAVKK